jgi:hypothetical protein
MPDGSHGPLPVVEGVFDILLILAFPASEDHVLWELGAQVKLGFDAVVDRKKLTDSRP